MRNLVSPVVAILTPFGADNRLDLSALGDYLDWLSACGVETLIANGTTGEFCSMTLEERMSVLECCRQRFPGTIVNNVSACCLADVEQLIRSSRSLADHVLVLPPFYYATPRQEGVEAFLRQVLEWSEQPVILYNFPRHTQCGLPPSLVGRLAVEYPNLVGVKDSGGDLDMARSYAKAAPSLQVFVGSDTRCLDVLAAGLAGSVTGAGNSFPEWLVGVRASFQRGDDFAARACQMAINGWHGILPKFDADEIALAKAVVSLRVPGFPRRVRPPMVMLPELGMKALADDVRRCLSASPTAWGRA